MRRIQEVTGRGRRQLLLVATSARNTSYDNWVFKLVLVRFRANGTLDVGFGTNGVRRYPIPAWSSAEDAAVDRDNRIVVLVSLSGGSHSCGDPTSGWEVVRRYRPNGDLDASFGRDGHTSIRAFEVRRVAIEPNGSLFVVGQGCTGDDPGRITWAFAAARLKEDGSPLVSFAERGVAEHTVAGGRPGRPGSPCSRTAVSWSPAWRRRISRWSGTSRPGVDRSRGISKRPRLERGYVGAAPTSRTRTIHRAPSRTVP